MTMTTLTSHEFDRDLSAPKKEARPGPVFIAVQGRPSYVLLTIEDYWRLTGRNLSLAEALAQPDVVDFEFNPRRALGGGLKLTDLD